MSSGYKVVDEDHVGGREQVASEWETIRAVFHNFSELPAKRDDLTESKVLKCHGLEWTIRLYPGGHPNSSEEDVYVSMYLCSKSCTNTNEIKTKYKMRIPSAGRAKGSGEETRIFSSKNTGNKLTNSWGFDNYAKREDVLNPSKRYLVDGNLTAEVDIQVVLDKPPTWTPTNTILSLIHI